jgi:hypothetical protein
MAQMVEKMLPVTLRVNKAFQQTYRKPFLSPVLDRLPGLFTSHDFRGGLKRATLFLT